MSPNDFVMKTSPTRAEKICGALLHRGLPEPDDPADPNLLPLLGYVFGRTGELACKRGELDRASLVLKWTKTIAMNNISFEQADPKYGVMARALHLAAIDFKKAEGTLNNTFKDFEKYVMIITDLAEKKRGQVEEMDENKLPRLLQKINDWAEDKIKQKKDMVTQDENRLQQSQTIFADALVDLLHAVEEAHYSRLRVEDESTVTGDLEAQLQALMLEAQGADSGAGSGTSLPGPKKSETLLAVKEEATGTAATEVPAEDLPATSTPARSEAKMSPGPEAANKIVLSEDAAAKEAKRLQHNARVTFDRRLKSGDCPDAILEKVKTFQNQPNRLKLLQGLFQDWFSHGMDFLKTSVCQEAQRRVTDEAKGKSVMQSFKHLKEKFGRRNAERIRDRKKDLEAKRDSIAEPRAWWFPHPDWEMFRCFESLEFELSDASGENLKQPVKKTNPHALTKKLNTKIQAVASRLTEIIVWDSKVHESQPQKTKDGFVEQLELKKTEMEKLKSSMEQLYSSLCSIEDKDLSGEQQKAVNDSMQAADALGNSLTGTVKPMKVSLEPPKVAKAKAKGRDLTRSRSSPMFNYLMRAVGRGASFTSARETLQAMNQEMQAHGIDMGGPCAKLEVPIDMVEVPIKPEQGKQKMELSLGMATIAAYMQPVVASFNLLVNGVRLSRSSEAVIYGLVAEIRGDWKWQKEWHFLASLFNMSEDAGRYLSEEQALAMKDMSMMAYLLLSEKVAINQCVPVRIKLL
ncbi:hypothetical protein AK812_SmicGene39206 [Symbiodinium microadriaticum]|uniref:Uncharacterized protein n=1 Tax=Symbiodinium microadriaticum TaxID=2951 RepID=A0A1Q9CBR7_SYMMI|nr:hypothetical protein AK812_SmicGene39206 [Symbiodinium microadriaticum]CAE7377248.1 unnamed protein product [Symbiodinium sp. KB8]